MLKIAQVFGNTPSFFTPKISHVRPGLDLHLFTQPYRLSDTSVRPGSHLRLLSQHLCLSHLQHSDLLLPTQLVRELGAANQLHLLEGSLKWESAGAALRATSLSLSLESICR